MQVNVNSINVQLKELPFSNKFVAKNVRVITHKRDTLFTLHAHCTADSNEPGRIYYCVYNFKGELEACNTLN
jgi:hypothetical protein